MRKQAGVIPIGNFNASGLAYSKYSGNKDSFYKIVGMNLHDEPGILKAAQKLTRETTPPTEYIKCQVASTNGRTYHFSADTGKIWEETGGVYTLVLTTTAAAGEVKCLGAYEYQGYIYWATQSRLHRILATDAEGAAEWGANKALNWATFTITDISFHPMVEQNQVLYIGDGNYLAQVDSGVFSANALDIESPLRIKSLGKISTDVLLGTYIDDNVAKTKIIRWNTWSVSFTNSDEIDEVGINAFLPMDNFSLVSAGVAGNIYFYDGVKLELWKKVPGTYTSTATALVHPSAVGSLNGNVLFGMSNISGNPVDQGVYQIGRHSRDFKYVMDLTYPLSIRSGSAFVLTGIEIGSILVKGQNVYVAWKYGATYGIDKIDYSNKLNGAYLATRVMVVEREKEENVSKIVLAYAELPTGTSVAIDYDKNYSGSYTTATIKTDTTRKIIYSDGDGLTMNTLELKFTLTTNSNDSPKLESAGVFLR